MRQRFCGEVRLIVVFLFCCDLQSARPWLLSWWCSASTWELVDFGSKRYVGAWAVEEAVNIKLWMRNCIVPFMPLLLCVSGQFSLMSPALMLWCDSIRSWAGRDSVSGVYVVFVCISVDLWYRSDVLPLEQREGSDCLLGSLLFGYTTFTTCNCLKHNVSLK
jgi:hypothetical protein